MSTRRGIYITLGIAATAIALVLLFLFDPTKTALAPKCTFHAVTGLSCPACGMQRFLHALMHGHISEAIRYNLLFVIMIPYVMLVGIQELLLNGQTRQRWRSILFSKPVTYALCCSAPAWFIIRNLLHI